MFRTLVVDDDIPTTEVICERVNWRSFGVDEVQTAHNITDAKSIILNFKPHLILCDIEMPKGSGLDLIRWARSEALNCKFIFLTCHEVFSYATEAMEYESVAYLTKPFQLHKTQAAIAKAVEIIKQDAAWAASKESLEELFWHDLLFGFISPRRESVERELSNRGLALKEEDAYGLVLVSVERNQLQDKNWDYSTFNYALRNIASEIVLDRLDTKRVFAYKQEHYYLVLLVWGSPDTPERVKEKCGLLIKAVTEHLGSAANCLISGRHTMCELFSLREKLEKENLENVVGTGCILMEENAKASEAAFSHELNIDALRKLLSEDKGVAAIEAVQTRLETLAADNKLTRELLGKLLQDYIQLVYVLLHENEILAHKLFEDSSSQALAQSAENSVFNAMRWVSHLTITAIGYIKEARKSVTILDNIQTYIKENYMNDISRDDIAAYVYLTPNYVSKIFKANKGYYLTDYINEVRVNKACELLRTTSLSVSEVAVAVGFDNFSYFSTLFRKVTGASPSGYRKD